MATLLLQPIHGVALEDYAAVIYFNNSGVSMEKLLSIIGITTIIWNEVHMLWTKRIEEDAGMSVVASYSRFYNEAVTNARFKNILSIN